MSPHVYSHDTLVSAAASEKNNPLEFLNTIQTTGLLPHVLRMQRSCEFIVLRIVDCVACNMFDYFRIMCYFGLGVNLLRFLHKRVSHGSVQQGVKHARTFDVQRMLPSYPKMPVYIRDECKWANRQHVNTSLSQLQVTTLMRHSDKHFFRATITECVRNPFATFDFLVNIA